MHYGVKFGDYHTLTDWGLYLLRGWTISPAPENRYTVSVPGADGQHDLTKSLTGRVTYGNRTAKMTFKSDAPRDSWEAIYHNIINAVNGETLDIVFDTDPEYYYTGFVKVGELIAINNNSFKVKFTIDLEPFKWEDNLTQVGFSLAEKATSTLVKITEGENVSKQYWNTDFRFGTKEIPTYDFSNFTELILTWEKGLGTIAHIQFVDGNGMILGYSVAHSVGTLPLLVSDLTDAGS